MTDLWRNDPLNPQELILALVEQLKREVMFQNPKGALCNSKAITRELQRLMANPIPLQMGDNDPVK